MEKQIYDWICRQLRGLLPENVQILSLYSKTERETDIVKVGVTPSGVYAVGTPFRICDLTLAAGVRREISDPESRLMEIWNPLRNWLGSGYRSVVQMTGGQMDAILPVTGEPAALGQDDSERFLLSVTSGKIYYTISTQNT